MLVDLEVENAPLSEVAKKLSEEIGEQRIADYWKFALEGKGRVYLQRLLDGVAEKGPGEGDRGRLRRDLDPGLRHEHDARRQAATSRGGVMA